MDTRTVTTRLAKRTGQNPRETSVLTEKLVGVLRDSLSDLNTVAIPGFGSFVPTKEDEHVASVDGKMMLMPPSIAIQFRPGVQLRKTTRRL